MPKKILALHTSNKSISIALYNNFAIKHIFTKCNKNHTEKILPILYKILYRENISINKINAIAFNKGPGHFTSTRAIINVAKGLSLGTNIPLISISSFNIIAEMVWTKKKFDHIVIIVYYKHNQIYFSKYIRNLKGFWKEHSMEILIDIKLIIIKLKQLKGSWTIASNTHLTKCLINYKKKDLFIQYYNLKCSHAKYMIPISLSLLQMNKLISPIQSFPIYFN